MTEPMTPNELAKMKVCVPLLPPPGDEVATKLLAEIDRLNKVLDQAIGTGRMELTIDGSVVFVATGKSWSHTVPELAAELERRSKP